MFDEKKKNKNVATDGNGSHMPMAVERGVVPTQEDLPAKPDGYLTEKEKNSLSEPRRITEIHSDEVDSMSGGYASVKGRRLSDNRLIWIVIAVMTVVCIVVGVCSSVLTGYFMRRGISSPPIVVDGDIQQNIAAVVASREPVIAEIVCGDMRGSGIAMKREGGKVYVLTNAHMIETSRMPKVRFYTDDSYYQGEVLGYNTFYDVAVITVVHDEVCVLGDDNFDATVTYNSGDYVVAIGNAFGWGLSAYDGIVSRTSEVLTYNSKKVPVMRTTAAINAGMSGGALFDMTGKMIGLNTYRMSSTIENATSHNASNDVEDTGFVMPISVVYSVYNQILAYSDGNGGEVGLIDLRYFSSTNTSRTGGIIFVDLGFTAEYRGGLLTVTSIDGNNAPSNLAVDDVITSVGSYTVTTDICRTAGEFLRYRKYATTGTRLRLTLTRGKDTVVVDYSDIYKNVA